MFMRAVKFRKTQWAAQVVWNTGNVYSTVVGKCFEMVIWKTEEIGAYCDKDKCHITDR
jgi:hypothetical protein